MTQDAEINPCHVLSLKLAGSDLAVRPQDPSPLSPAKVLELAAADWGKAAAIAQTEGWRWAGVWAEDRGARLDVRACLEKQNRKSVV